MLRSSVSVRKPHLKYCIYPHHSAIVIFHQQNGQNDGRAQQFSSRQVAAPAEAGFILTRHWSDTPRGIEVRYWLATDNGPRHVSVPLQQAVGFVPHRELAESRPFINNIPGATLTAPQLKDFHQDDVSAVYCRQYRQLQQLEKQLGEQHLHLYEADIRPASAI